MATCKECFHEKACKEMFESMGYKVNDDYKGNANRCNTFINKADVVPVVRCKDCTEWDKDECECSHWYGFKENDYCSYGERKDTDG